MNIPMVDTLTATIDIEDYERSASKIVSILESKKNEAKLVAANFASEKVLVTIGDQTYEVLSNGAKGYAYILHNDYYEVKVAQYRSKKEEFFPVFIRIKSEWLWAIGPDRSWSMILDWINTNIGIVKTNKINRLDLCCHTDQLALTLDDIETFKGNFFNDQVIRDRRKVTGVLFGSRSSRKIYCRIYDKVKEINKKRKKLWFNLIWEKAGLEKDKVWNVEFELNRDFFKEHQIESVEDAFQRIRSIWEHCTKVWIVKMKLDHTRIERCSVEERWIDLQNAFNCFESKQLIRRDNQLDYDATAMVPGAIGNITSYAAKVGITNIDSIFYLLKVEGQKYLKNAKQTDFQGAVDKKRAILV